MSTKINTITTGPPPHLLRRRKVRLAEGLKTLWRSRELVFSLAERELRVRYKQAALGFAWGVLAPLSVLIVFTLFIQRRANIDSEGAPYLLFAYVGLIPWTALSTSASLGGLSLVNNVSLLGKVHCPREVFPLAAVLVALFDMLVALPLLVLAFLIVGFTPTAAAIWIPVGLAIQLTVMVGAALLLSIVIVFLRDLKHALQILLQLGLFATPVFYGLSYVPVSVRPLYAFLNPLGPAIDLYRRAILFSESPDLGLTIMGALGAMTLVVVGYWAFKRFEPGIADVA